MLETSDILILMFIFAHSQFLSRNVQFLKVNLKFSLNVSSCICEYLQYRPPFKNRVEIQYYTLINKLRRKSPTGFGVFLAMRVIKLTIEHNTSIHLEYAVFE